MASYGYACVSSLDQNLGIQRAALKAAGCDVIRAEKASGARRDGRTELQVLLDFLRPGDAFVVTRIDRLARSLRDPQNIVHELKERRMTFREGIAAAKARGVYKGRKPKIDAAVVRKLRYGKNWPCQERERARHKAVPAIFVFGKKAT